MRLPKLIALALAGALTLQHCGSSSQLPTAKNFLEALQTQTNATTYLRLVESAGGFANILGKEKYTLLVPMDAAFSTLGFEKLMELMSPSNTAPAMETLKAHIATGSFSPEQLAKSGSLPLLNGKSAAVAAGSELQIGGAAVVQSVKTKEGYVHFLNGIVK